MSGKKSKEEQRRLSVYHVASKPIADGERRLSDSCPTSKLRDAAEAVRRPPKSQPVPSTACGSTATATQLWDLPSPLLQTSMMSLPWTMDGGMPLHGSTSTTTPPPLLQPQPVLASSTACEPPHAESLITWGSMYEKLARSPNPVPEEQQPTKKATGGKQNAKARPTSGSLTPMTDHPLPHVHKSRKAAIPSSLSTARIDAETMESSTSAKEVAARWRPSGATQKPLESRAEASTTAQHNAPAKGAATSSQKQETGNVSPGLSMKHLPNGRTDDAGNASECDNADVPHLSAGRRTSLSYGNLSDCITPGSCIKRSHSDPALSISASNSLSHHLLASSSPHGQGRSAALSSFFKPRGSVSRSPEVSVHGQRSPTCSFLSSQQKGLGNGWVTPRRHYWSALMNSASMAFFSDSESSDAGDGETHSGDGNDKLSSNAFLKSFYSEDSPHRLVKPVKAPAVRAEPVDEHGSSLGSTAFPSFRGPYGTIAIPHDSSPESGSTSSEETLQSLASTPPTPLEAAAAVDEVAQARQDEVMESSPPARKVPPAASTPQLPQRLHPKYLKPIKESRKCRNSRWRHLWRHVNPYTGERTPMVLEESVVPWVNSPETSPLQPPKCTAPWHMQQPHLPPHRIL